MSRKLVSPRARSLVQGVVSSSSWYIIWLELKLTTKLSMLFQVLGLWLHLFLGLGLTLKLGSTSNSSVRRMQRLGFVHLTSLSCHPSTLFAYVLACHLIHLE